MKKNNDFSKKNQLIKVLLVEKDVSKTAEFIAALDKTNYLIAQVSTSSISLLKDVNDYEPDVIIIDIESPDRDMLDSLNQVSKSAPKPVVMFSDREDTGIN